MSVSPRTLLALVALNGCGGTFEQGQATLRLGQDPYGGAYNPALRRCTVRESDASGGGGGGGSSVYDGDGRLTYWDHDDDLGIPHTIETEWDGPCKAHEYEVMQNGEAWNEDWECDDHGWPVSSHRAVTESSNPLEPIDTTWTNTYDGDLLVTTVVTTTGGSATSFAFDYAWTDGRLTREAVTQPDFPDGDPIVLTYTYEDGWITAIAQSNGITTTYTFEDGRLVTMADESTRTEWLYTEGAWPTRRTYYDDNGGEHPFTLLFDCP